MLFLQVIVWFEGSAGAVNERGIMAEVAVLGDRGLKIKDGWLGLPFFAQRRTALLRQGYAALQGSVDSCKYHYCFSTP